MTTIPQLPAAASVSLADLFPVDQSVAASVSPNGRKTRSATLSQLGQLVGASTLPFLNVKNAPFNAKGDDVADDFPAFNRAFSSAPSGTLFVPPGTYNCSSAVSPPSNWHLQGAGAGTIIKNNGSMGGPPENNGLSIFGTLTGTPFISGTAVTYPINAPTESTNTVTTTTAANAGNFSAGQLILISGGGHGTDFWYPDWITTVVSANAGTGVITLAENLPFGGSDITTVQKVLSQPQNIKISDMTILGANDGSLVVQFAKDITIENVTIQAGSGGVSGASLALIGSRNVTLRNCKGYGVVFDVFSCFDSHILNNNLVSGFLLADGGTQNTLFSGNVISDPTIGQNSLAKANGIDLAIFTRRNRIIGNSIVNSAGGFTGINVNGSAAADGSHIIIGNTVTGVNTTTTFGISINGAVNNTVVGNWLNNLAVGVNLANGSIGNTVEANTPVGVTTPYQIDSTSGIREPFTAALWTILSPAGATPSVQNGHTFRVFQSGAQNTTNFINGITGQEILIFFGDSNTTLKFSGTLHLSGGADYNPAANTIMRFVNLLGNWYEMSRVTTN